MVKVDMQHLAAEARLKAMQQQEPPILLFEVPSKLKKVNLTTTSPTMMMTQSR
jgi:hypothetical protein